MGKLQVGSLLRILYPKDILLIRRRFGESGRVNFLRGTVKPWLGLRGGTVLMDDNERDSVREVLTLARLAIVAMLVIGGYANRSAIIGMI